MKKEKLKFLKPKEGNSIGQWLIEQGISAGFPSPADDFKEIRISLDEELEIFLEPIDLNQNSEEILEINDLPD